MAKNLLLCLDRDGTIIYDDKYHLGSQKNWKKLIKFRPGVINGLKKLNKKFSKAKIYLISNQSGVAIKEFPLLTSNKAKSVCRYIVKLMNQRGVKVERCFICPHTTPSYVKSHPQFTFEKKKICKCKCAKPDIGLVEQSLKDAKWKKEYTDIYAIGDRMSDVKTGINVGGFGILFPFVNRPGEVRKVRKLKSKKKYIAKNFNDAVEFLVKRENTIGMR
jgi:histidinol-phosphate phosphatase family protein